MKDSPILFSAPMISAIRDGRKTQTRRVLKIRGHKTFSEFGKSDTQAYDWHFRDSDMRWHDYRHNELLNRLQHHKGDRLWVREAWAITTNVNCEGDVYWPNRPHFLPREDEKTQCVIYRADGELNWCDEDGFSTDKSYWKPSIHMPRRYSRITLEVTDVRVERLQDICVADAEAEGTLRQPYTSDFANVHAVDMFRRLWNSINGTGAWDANPWVTATTFKPIFKNIDALAA